MSPERASVPEAADLQLELLMHSWEKKVLTEIKREISSEERVLTAAVLIYTQKVFWGEHPLFPSIVLNPEIPSRPLGCSQATEFTFTKNLCPLKCRNPKENLKYIYVLHVFWLKC